MCNLKFSYMYRDGSNHKDFGGIVFPNPQKLAFDTVTKALRKAFMVDGLFVADQVRVPEVFLFHKWDLNSDDHCYHEFLVVKETRETPSDLYGRTFAEFVNEVASESRNGWKEFDPLERTSGRTSYTPLDR